jgi:hypothetical protein
VNSRFLQLTKYAVQELLVAHVDEKFNVTVCAVNSDFYFEMKH